MTDTRPLYKVIDGEPMLSTRAFALLMDLPEDVLRAEVERQREKNPDSPFRVSNEWRKRGVRVRKEVQAALGYEAGMKECIDFLADKAGL